MKRIVIGLAIAGAAAFAAPPASADYEVKFCGITPRYPCGVCWWDHTTGSEVCVPGPIST